MLTRSLRKPITIYTDLESSDENHFNLTLEIAGEILRNLEKNQIFYQLRNFFTIVLFQKHFSLNFEIAGKICSKWEKFYQPGEKF